MKLWPRVWRLVFFLTHGVFTVTGAAGGGGGGRRRRRWNVGVREFLAPADPVQHVAPAGRRQPAPGRAAPALARHRVRTARAADEPHPPHPRRLPVRQGDTQGAAAERRRRRRHRDPLRQGSRAAAAAAVVSAPRRCDAIRYRYEMRF